VVNKEIKQGKLAGFLFFERQIAMLSFKNSTRLVEYKEISLFSIPQFRPLVEKCIKISKKLHRYFDTHFYI